MSLESLDREIEHGLVVWSAELDGPEGRREVSALDDGTLVSIEEEAVPAEMPAPVREAALRALGTEPDEADHMHLVVYELEDRTAIGLTRERLVDALGRLLFTRTFAAADETEDGEAATELPEAGRPVIVGVAGGAPVESIEVEQEGGRTVQVAVWHAAGGRHELKVLGDGTVIVHELRLGPLPATVASFFSPDRLEGDTAGNAADPQSAEGPDENAGVERMLLDLWEVEATVEGVVRTALILRTGEILGDVTMTDRDDDGHESDSCSAR